MTDLMSYSRHVWILDYNLQSKQMFLKLVLLVNLAWL